MLLPAAPAGGAVQGERSGKGCYSTRRLKGFNRISAGSPGPKDNPLVERRLAERPWRADDEDRIVVHFADAGNFGGVSGGSFELLAIAPFAWKRDTHCSVHHPTVPRRLSLGFLLFQCLEAPVEGLLGNAPPSGGSPPGGPYLLPPCRMANIFVLAKRLAAQRPNRGAGIGCYGGRRRRCQPSVLPAHGQLGPARGRTGPG